MTVEMVGKVFGRLTVIAAAGHRKAVRLYLVRCQCGVEKTVDGSNLRWGTTKSCGCLHKDNLRARLSKGSDTATSEYRTWSRLRDRCNNPRNRDYPGYGGRGIGYHSSWESYACFLADVGYKPFPGAELERIDNDKGYSADNCRWATRTEQNRNKRNTRWVLLQGRKISLAEAAETVEVNYSTLLSRIARGHNVGHGITLPEPQGDASNA